MPCFNSSREISKSIFIAGKFSAGDNITWEAMRVILALKFAVLPDEIDKLGALEISQIMGVLDGQAKAGGAGNIDGR